MAHSNQIREFLLTSRGVQLREVYVGPGGVLTGSARVAQEEEEQRREFIRVEENRNRELAAKANLRSLEAKIAALEAEKEAQNREFALLMGEGQARKEALLGTRNAIRASRGMVVENSDKVTRPNGRGVKV